MCSAVLQTALDAIEPNQLRQLVQAVIEVHLPADELAVLQAAEESERTLLLNVGEQYAHTGGGTMTQGNGCRSVSEFKGEFSLQIDMGNDHEIMLTVSKTGGPPRVLLWCAKADHSFIATEDEHGETFETFRARVACTQRSLPGHSAAGPGDRTEAETREQPLERANVTGCGHVGFLWRLRMGGDGWHCYACERMPDVPAPAPDIELLNAGRCPVPILRKKLGQ